MKPNPRSFLRGNPVQEWMRALLPTLPHESAIPTVERALANYLIDHDTFAARRTLKQEGLLAAENALDDVLHSLRGESAYRLYRAAVVVIRKHPDVFKRWKKERVHPQRWTAAQNRYPDVRVKTLQRLWAMLSDANRSRLVKDALDKNQSLRKARPASLEVMSKWLDKRAKKIAYRKLRFLADNDGGVGLEDLKADLMHHAARSFKESEFKAGERGQANVLYMRNYALRSMLNRAESIIQERQTQKRAQVVRTVEGTKNSHPEYQRTVLSLDRRPVGRGHVSSSDTFVTLMDVVSEENTTEEQLYVHEVRARLNVLERRVLDTYLGTRNDRSWEEWAQNHRVDMTDPQSPAVLQALCRYHGIELDDLKKHFSPTT